MSTLPVEPSKLPTAQEAIKDKCFHPSGTFSEFEKPEIEQSIPDRFEQMVHKYPYRLAVKDRNHTMTYDELNRTANRVARAILEQRGKEQEPIALLLEPGDHVIAAILGVLKAGKFYVPLDPSSPDTRMGSMLEDSQGGLILVSNRTFYLASELTKGGLQLINIDILDKSRCSEENVGLTIAPDSHVFILYTSGSTGEPKGIVHSHRNILHDIMNYTNSLRICADDRLSLLRPITVIGAVRQIFGALLNGAALLPINLKEEGVGSVAQWLIDEDITICRLVPTIFRHFTSILTGEVAFPKLRVIYLAAEPASLTEFNLYQRHFSPSCILINGLGSTETLEYRWYFMDKETQMTTNTVPVGFPIHDQEVLLIDDQDEQVEIGSTGEIAVRSRFLFSDYWQSPELTRCAFVPHLAGPDNRVYRTGDLGRIDSSGCLEHRGRKDFKVMIRGYSVETVEIEMILLEQDHIREAVVVARQDWPGQQRLVAYVVLTGKGLPNISQLRSTLLDKLPEYMLPSAFVILDSLPVLPNGKLDRKGLPAPGTARPVLENTFAPPRTPVEQALVEIWSEVLSLDQVGIHDKFLELGGNSLLASQVITRVLRSFAVEFSPKDLFEAPTVAAMAIVIVQGQVESADPVGLERFLQELESLP